MNSSIFKRIMVATDGSESAKDAVATAIGRGIPGENLTEGKQATAYVENAGRAANIEVEPVILRGIPAEEIIGFAEKVVRHATKSVLVVR